MPTALRAKPRPQPTRKPMLAIRRVSLFQREVRVGLSSAAVELLFRDAAVLTEGQLDGEAFYGSTMVTIDLDRRASAVSDTCDASTAQSLCALLATDSRIRERAWALAAKEAERLAGCPLASVQIDMQVRHSAAQIQLDIDIEGAKDG